MTFKDLLDTLHRIEFLYMTLENSPVKVVRHLDEKTIQFTEVQSVLFDSTSNSLLLFVQDNQHGGKTSAI